MKADEHEQRHDHLRSPVPSVIADRHAQTRDMYDVVRVSHEPPGRRRSSSCAAIKASVQVYEETLRPGPRPSRGPVDRRAAVSVELAPRPHQQSIYDGIQRPLDEHPRPGRANASPAASTCPRSTASKKWYFEPVAKAGDRGGAAATCWAPCRKRPSSSTRSWCPTSMAGTVECIFDGRSSPSRRPCAVLTDEDGNDHEIAHAAEMAGAPRPSLSGKAGAHRAR